MQKIVFVSNYPEGFGGGEGRVAFELARVLARENNVTMICTRSDFEWAGLICPHSAKVDGSLLRYDFPCSFHGEYAIPYLGRTALKRLFAFLDETSPDVVHCHVWWGIAAVCQQWALSRGVPFVYTVHLLPSQQSEFMLLPPVLSWLKAPVAAFVSAYLRRFYSGCRAIVALNEAAHTDIRNFGFAGRLSRIPNGRELARLSSLSRPEITAGKKILSFIGIVSERKNQKFLVKVMDYLPSNYTLVLAGPFQSEAYRKEFPEQSERIRYLGKQDQDGVRRCLEQSHLLVSASVREVQSLVVIEALASGTPVVGLENETLVELVDDSVGFRLPRSTSPAAFAEAVMRICEDPDTGHYAALCERAKKRVEDYDWDRVAEKTIELYKDCPKSEPGIVNPLSFYLPFTILATRLIHFFWVAGRRVRKAEKIRLLRDSIKTRRNAHALLHGDA